MIEKFLRVNLLLSRVTTDGVADAMPKVVSCLQTVGSTISSTLGRGEQRGGTGVVYHAQMGAGELQ